MAGTAAAAPKTTVIIRKGEIAKGAVTAKALAKGAVHPKALADGAVTAGAIKPGAVGAPAINPGAVGPAALAPDSVTAPAIAPGSVYGGSLGEVTVHSAVITDIDADPANNEWTASAPVTALCATGERLLSGGVVFTNTADREVGTITTEPFVNGSQNGWVGAITTNAGGLAKAEVQVLCLK